MRDEIESLIRKMLLKASESNPISSFEMVEIIRDEFPHASFSTSQIRNVINRFRQHFIPVIGTRWGYYISYREEDILKQIDSLDGRIAAIELAKRGLWDTIENVRKIDGRIKYAKNKELL
jgi:hypothetical protein